MTPDSLPTGNGVTRRTTETDYRLTCSEFLATRTENVNLLRMFRAVVLRNTDLPEIRLIKTLSEWQAEFKKFTK